ncbi:DNA-directed RNA polymerase subunit alpha [Thermosulfidibacter takaii ABI70S6]|uniref:DNA-directed RNA polymerase subunit alpha n=1 Tax=Thermosulfidibacter takaii (strain DSM 17441 / JCM 13301 / NBRC 103674 / ABI70S6) TaxID=1298851 RepID=A0A0S3QV34_THET7|nr:DNA-directed RNA polymerase subunit alpha [Thermosulfidibacter takaii]BAT72194.1 DNA-directed RNA polymerase subunit alpha [Thermosulfidibacter takaii ABI70S6]
MFDTWNYIIRPTKLLVDQETLTDKYCRIIVEPLDRGYGITIGNALRRILLSSIPGYAVTAVKIDGVYHEFTSIPGVVEDVTDIILNLKQLEIKGDVEEPATLRIEAKGPCKVYARDIQVPTGIEILNPDLYIATLDNEETELNMKMLVEEGKGYLPTEERDLQEFPVGTILVDAVFTPVKKVNFQVQQARLGRATDYDRLILEIWTNGAVAALDAFKMALQILKDHVELLFSIEVGEVKAEEKDEAGAADELQEKLNMGIEELNLSVRAYNCLKKKGINTVGELVRLRREDLMSLKNFGKKSLEEVEKVLASLGLSLGMDLEQEGGNETQG